MQRSFGLFGVESIGTICCPVGSQGSGTSNALLTSNFVLCHYLCYYQTFVDIHAPPIAWSLYSIVLAAGEAP